MKKGSIYETNIRGQYSNELLISKDFYTVNLIKKAIIMYAQARFLIVKAVHKNSLAMQNQKMYESVAKQVNLSLVLIEQILEKKRIKIQNPISALLQIHRFARANNESVHSTKYLNTVTSKLARRSVDYGDSCSSRPLNSTMSLKYSFRTKQGKLFTNPDKVNQDTFIAYARFLQPQQHLFAVCDGHGVNGHLVSNFLKQMLPITLAQNLSSNSALHSLVTGLDECNNSLNDSDINIALSGSTLICLLIHDRTLYSANIGDSRAILSTTLGVLPLSIDHKPQLPNEKNRIIKNGGNVQQLRDQEGNFVGPMRVWVKGENAPGLAMSRSFGDSMAQQVGVTAEPEIFTTKLGKEAKFLIIASDGVWEYLTNQQCVDIVEPFYLKNDIEGACDALMNQAYLEWTREDDSVVDDITFIIVFLSNY